MYCGNSLHSKELKELAHKVRMKRLERRWSQEMLANKSKCHTNQISRLELAKVIPSLTLIIRVARALGMSPRELLPEK